MKPRVRPQVEPLSRYSGIDPLVIAHGHFPAGPDGFREMPPDPDLKPDYSKRFQLAGYNRIQQEYGTLQDTLASLRSEPVS